MHYALCIKKFARRTLKNPSDSFLHYEVRTANFRILRILLCEQRTLEFFTPITPLYTIPTKFAIYWRKFIRRSKNLSSAMHFSTYGENVMWKTMTQDIVSPEKRLILGKNSSKTVIFSCFSQKYPKMTYLIFPHFPQAFPHKKAMNLS